MITKFANRIEVEFLNVAIQVLSGSPAVRKLVRSVHELSTSSKPSQWVAAVVYTGLIGLVTGAMVFVLKSLVL